MLPFPHFESAITQRRTLAKGKALFESGSSARADIISGNTFHVYYPSNEDADEEYKVIIQIQDGWVSYFSCPCPTLQGPMCEHSIAALYEIKQQNVYSNEDDERMRVSRGNRKQLTAKTEKKDPKKKKKEESEDELESDEEEEADLDITHTQKELECQICLNIVKKPVLMACRAHSVCFECIESLLNHKKKGRGGKKEVHCPTCGTKSGSLKVKSAKDLKVNKNLQQLKLAYKDDKKSWEEEKLKLQIAIAEMKAQKEKEEQELVKAPKNEEKQDDLSRETSITEKASETKENLEKMPEKQYEGLVISEKSGGHNSILKEQNNKEKKYTMDLEGEVEKNEKPSEQRRSGRLKRKEVYEKSPQELSSEDNIQKKVLKRVKL